MSNHRDTQSQFLCIADDVQLGTNVKLAKFINLYGGSIGDNTKIGTFVEVQKNAVIGKNCKISSHTFICEGVTIEHGVFISHGVMFINVSESNQCKRSTRNRSRLESGAHIRSQRRFDWIG